MSGTLQIKTYPEPPLCRKEILRYAGCREADTDVLARMESCWQEIREGLKYRACIRELPVDITGDECDFAMFRLRSRQLARNLEGCRRVMLFAATIGVEIDRKIARYGRISPSKALWFQAIGAERIEALCDAVCAEFAREGQWGLRPRFSPGYGDLPLTAQREIFSVLDCTRQIGVSLSDSLLMLPSKSVTAFVGLAENGERNLIPRCTACKMIDCEFRGAL